MNFEQRLDELEARVRRLEEADAKRAKRTKVTGHEPSDVVAPTWAELIRSGMSQGDIQAEYTRFCSHAISAGRLCVGLEGWRAAWRNWLASRVRG